MNTPRLHWRALRRAGMALVVASSGLWHANAHAGLFDDEEARKAIIELRQRVEAMRQATDAGQLRLQQALQQQQQQLQQVQEQQADMVRRSSDESSQLRRALLDLQNQIESMRADFARINGQNEQLARELADMNRRQRDLAQGQNDLGRAVDERVRQLEPVKVSVDGRDILVEPAERRAYDAALASFRAGDFPGAQNAFLALMARYPKTGYLPSALFWLGNAQYATRDYKEAIANFRIMLQAAPEHVSAAEAMLSIANCQIELKDARGARKTLEDLAKAYPQSEAAQAGKERLARLR